MASSTRFRLDATASIGLPTSNRDGAPIRLRFEFADWTGNHTLRGADTTSLWLVQAGQAPAAGSLHRQQGAIRTWCPAVGCRGLQAPCDGLFFHIRPKFTEGKGLAGSGSEDFQAEEICFMVFLRKRLL